MNKSFNDIKEQVERCIKLANELGGRYTANAKHRADVQYFAQLGSKVRTQRGISLFEKDKDSKHPLLDIEITKTEQKPDQEPEPAAVAVEIVKKEEPTPTEKAKNMISFTAWMNASEENRKKTQDAARHEFINKMYAELLHDYTVCQIEEWDMFEFPRMIRDALAVCFPKQPKQLCLF